MRRTSDHPNCNVNGGVQPSPIIDTDPQGVNHITTEQGAVAFLAQHPQRGQVVETEIGYLPVPVVDLLKRLPAPLADRCRQMLVADHEQLWAHAVHNKRRGLPDDSLGFGACVPAEVADRG